MSELRFSSKEKALQHLADITDSRIKIGSDARDINQALLDDDEEKFKQLLKDGVQPSKRTLSFAITNFRKKKDPFIIKALLSAGLESGRPDEKHLLLAIEDTKDPEVVAMLLEDGVKPDKWIEKAAQKSKDEEIISLITEAL